VPATLRAKKRPLAADPTIKHPAILFILYILSKKSKAVPKKHDELGGSRFARLGRYATIGGLA
jgi:hypothetical protein